MLSRRALLGAGAVAGLGLAGCGAPDAPAVKASDVMDTQLGVSRAALASYPSTGETARLRQRAKARVDRLEAALRLAGGSPGRQKAGKASPPGVERALAAERLALRTHVAGVGLLSDRASRELFAGLIAETAQAESELLTMLGRRPLETAFPGQPPNPR